MDDHANFNDQLRVSHIGYFVAHLDTLIPDPQVNVRPVRRSGVEKLKRLIRPGYNRDSVITCFEKRGECDKNGIPSMK